MPLRWQDPAAVLSRKYTTKSDVYSFGVVMYEVYSGGLVPFADLSSMDCLRAVAAGRRLDRPSNDTPAAAFDLLRQCTLRHSQKRPAMVDVERQLRQLRGNAGVGALTVTLLPDLDPFEETSL